ncbi:uncharacterized protein LOC124882486 [Girardinichthys multiradiatus]|uniref:uncharacterized protein LOC124882486 n=1 Tax=Girardinichthys multiradiatus TaxID=208333 RepID=UPI001FAE61BD|nr:uncharacterized protein LOC124882486 [Girardinichthys multiradiatus]
MSASPKNLAEHFEQRSHLQVLCISLTCALKCAKKPTRTDIHGCFDHQCSNKLIQQGGLGDASAAAPSLQAFQGFSGELVPVLVPEPCHKGFEEEAPPDPVSEEFKEQLVLVLASEPRDEWFEEEAPPDLVSVGFKVQLVLVLASEGPTDAASVSKGPVGSASASEGSPGHVPEEPVGGLPPRPVSEQLLGFLWGVFMELKPDSTPEYGAQDYEAPDSKSDSKPDSKLRGSSILLGRPRDRGSSTLLSRPPDRESSTLLGRPPDQPAVAGRPGLYVSAGLQVFAAVAG